MCHLKSLNAGKAEVGRVSRDENLAILRQQPSRRRNFNFAGRYLIESTKEILTAEYKRSLLLDMCACNALCSLFRFNPV